MNAVMLVWWRQRDFSTTQRRRRRIGRNDTLILCSRFVVQLNRETDIVCRASKQGRDTPLHYWISLFHPACLMSGLAQVSGAFP